MHRSFIMALLLLCGSSAGVLQAQTAKATIVKGKIEGLESGRLYMLALTGENKIDTLGTALFQAPDFAIGGVLKEPMVVQIVVAGYEGGFTLLAEPGVRYEALLKDGNGAYIRGGYLQDEWVAHKAHADSLRLRIIELQKRYETLRGENKFRSASQANDSLKACREQMHRDTQEFLARHDDLITAYTYQANALMKDASLEESRRLYDSMGAGAKATLSARLMKERIDRLAKTATGLQAPDFTLTDLEGKSVTLSKVPGKIKVLDFWASWCGPCRMHNPALKQIYADFHDKGLEVIGISLDDKKERWAGAVEKDGLTWINVSSLKGWKCEVAQEYNIKAIPAILILDENNRIIAKDLRGDKLREFLEGRL